jgi:hypothetical protein
LGDAFYGLPSEPPKSPPSACISGHRRIAAVSITDQCLHNAETRSQLDVFGSDIGPHNATQNLHNSDYVARRDAL